MERNECMNAYNNTGVEIIARLIYNHEDVFSPSSSTIIMWNYVR